MKLESLTNEAILKIINALYPEELPMEFLEETKYYPEGCSDVSEIQSLDTVNLMDLVLKSFEETDVPNQVIYLNTDDYLISVFEIYGDDIEEQHLNENPNWHHLGNILTDTINNNPVFCNLYLYID